MDKKNFFIGVAIIICMIIGFILILGTDGTNDNVGSLIKVDYNRIKEMVDNKETFALVVSQSTCSHCATYKPKIMQITKDYGFDVYYIDYDKESDDTIDKFLEEFKLSGATPMTLFIKDGRETSVLNRIEGDLNEEKVIEKFKKMGFIEE